MCVEVTLHGAPKVTYDLIQFLQPSQYFDSGDRGGSLSQISQTASLLMANLLV